MKQRWNAAAVLALVLVLLAGPALAWDQAKTQAEIQALFDQAAAGIMNKDVAAVTATSTPQAVMHYKGGMTMTVAQWAELMGKDLQDMQEIKSKFTVKKVWPKGKDMVGAFYHERHDFMKPSDPGSKHAIAAQFRALAVKTPQGWRFIEFTELGTRFTRDGKAIKGPAPAAKPRAKPQG